jgi:hypothetical protein
MSRNSGSTPIWPALARNSSPVFDGSIRISMVRNRPRRFFPRERISSVPFSVFAYRLASAIAFPFRFAIDRDASIRELGRSLSSGIVAKTGGQRTCAVVVTLLNSIEGRSRGAREATIEAANGGRAGCGF